MPIKIFTTGGSLDKGYSTKESSFTVQEPQIVGILEQANVLFKYEIESLFRKDSLELTDEDVMYPLREELGIGVATAKAGGPKGIVAKAKIAKLLGIEINSVNLFKERMKGLL